MDLEQLKSKALELLKLKPESRRLVIWCAAYTAVILVGIAVFSPAHGRASGLRSEIKAIESRAGGMGGGLQGPGHEIFFAQVKSTFQSEMRQYVSPAEISSVIQDISSKAGEHGVTIRRINSDLVSGGDKEGFRKILIRMSLEGGYSEVGNFSGSLKKGLKAFFTWEAVEVGSLNPEKGLVSADLTIAFYSLKEMVAEP